MNLQIIGNMLVVENDGKVVFEHSKGAVAVKYHSSGNDDLRVTLDSHFANNSECDFEPITIQYEHGPTVDGSPVTEEELRGWLRTNLGFNPAGPAASTTDPFATLSQLAAVQTQLDETEIIARSDTLQPGETIAEAGTRFDAAGRRWETLNDLSLIHI